MPSNMEDALNPEQKQENAPYVPLELDILQREERCRKALKTVRRAVFMRLFVTCLLIWALLQTSMELWIIGMMTFVMLINLAGIMPLVGEWKKQRKILKEIIAEDEDI